MTSFEVVFVVITMKNAVLFDFLVTVLPGTVDTILIEFLAVNSIQRFYSKEVLVEDSLERHKSI